VKKATVKREGPPSKERAVSGFRAPGFGGSSTEGDSGEKLQPILNRCIFRKNRRKGNRLSRGGNRGGWEEHGREETFRGSIKFYAFVADQDKSSRTARGKSFEDGVFSG